MTPGQSTSAVVRIPKARSTSSVSLSPAKAKKGTRVRLTAKVDIPGSAPARGKIVIKRGKQTLRVIPLKPKHQGTRTVNLPKKKLKKGNQRIRIIFRATPKITRSQSKVVVLRIT